MTPEKDAAVFLAIGAALVLTPVAGQAAYDAVYDLTLDYPDTLGEPVDSVQDAYRKAQGKGQGVEFDDVVHITHRDSDGTVLNQFRVHNALMEGEKIIRNQTIGNTPGTNRNWTAISLGNGSAPTDFDDTMPGTGGVGEFATGEFGFGPNRSTFVERIDVDDTHAGAAHTDGIEWNVTAKFTSTGITNVNTTALKDDWPGSFSTIDYFAGADFGRTIPFESGDTLTVEWNVDPD